VDGGGGSGASFMGTVTQRSLGEPVRCDGPSGGSPDAFNSRRCGLCRSRAAASRRCRQHTHVRALAYESILIVLSGFIGAIGLASLLHGRSGSAAWSWSSADRSLPALPDAWSVKPPRAAQTPGARQRLIGHAAAFATGTLAMAQVERSANRIAGLDEDGPPVRRSVVAACLMPPLVCRSASAACSSAQGGPSPRASDGRMRRRRFGRSPVGRSGSPSPRSRCSFCSAQRRVGRSGHHARSSPGRSVAVVMWAAFTGLLSLNFAIQTGSAYGSLLSIVALLIWSNADVARPSPRFGYGVSTRRAATS
jgi:hypothetical protein